MRAIVRPELCAVCFGPLYHFQAREYERPTAACRNQDCLVYGREFYYPKVDCEPAVRAALLRQKVA
jgi:hypothetical protein